MKRSQFPWLAALGFLLVFPFFLNRRFRVVRRVLVRAHPAQVYPFLSNLKNWPLWIPSLGDRVEYLKYSGDEEGPGAVVSHEGCCCEGKIRIRHVRPDERVAFEIESASYEIEGIVSLEPVEEMTRITLVCMWAPRTMPYARYFDLALKLWLKRETTLALTDLQLLVEEA
ncbi:MAG: SRPBCC family protein [Chthoniobacteraceae bacterium]